MRGNRDNCNTNNCDNDELVIELAMETIITYIKMVKQMMVSLFKVNFMGKNYFVILPLPCILPFIFSLAHCCLFLPVITALALCLVLSLSL